jgi:ubiquinone/menaquinone biosynthesis C-methylase UbiE
MPEDTANHWQSVYWTTQPDQVSWYAPHLNVSIELLKQAGLKPDSRVIDIGAGASTLVDDLLDMGLHDITVVDISSAALGVARRRLGARAGNVQWQVGDAARLDLQPLNYDFWHDRAVLHFLVDAANATAYVANATRAIANGGFAVIGGFAADGPERCSGLPVVRREPRDIAKLFGEAFTLVHSHHEKHLTPWGASQSFAYAVLRKSRNT